MDLKNLKVQELSKKELKKTDGGFFGPFRAGLSLAYRQMWGIHDIKNELSNVRMYA